MPILVDEIQSCMWSPELFMFREYGLNPDFVSIGKGFPGGQYPASRILATAEFDNLPQFGALVTNGQEELAALAYLVTMAFVEATAITWLRWATPTRQGLRIWQPSSRTSLRRSKANAISARSASTRPTARSRSWRS